MLMWWGVHTAEVGVCGQVCQDAVGELTCLTNTVSRATSSPNCMLGITVSETAVAAAVPAIAAGVAAVTCSQDRSSFCCV